VDADEGKVGEIKQEVTSAVCMNAANEEALASLGVEGLDAVVVAIGRDVEASLLITALLKQYGCQRTIARASNGLHARILQMLGADRVIYPEVDEARRLVRVLTSPHILDQIYLEGDVEFALLQTPDSFLGKSLRELALRQKYSTTVVAVRTVGTDTEPPQMLFPDADYVMQEGDQIYVVGSQEGLRRLDAMH
jgi:trk system potassium uptake protein TrkA